VIAEVAPSYTAHSHSVSGFAGTVAFKRKRSPTGVTASFNPTSITLSIRPSLSTPRMRHGPLRQVLHGAVSAPECTWGKRDAQHNRPACGSLLMPMCNRGGMKLAVTPVGEPLTLNATVPANPLTAVTVAV